ncbi:MAG: hypothetical protein J6S96_05940 [Muribaculaceae bacterium]|nr:hypothetical protein [Muribaculaceae bacterium]
MAKEKTSIDAIKDWGAVISFIVQLLKLFFSLIGEVKEEKKNGQPMAAVDFPVTSEVLKRKRRNTVLCFYCGRL